MEQELGGIKLQYKIFQGSGFFNCLDQVCNIPYPLQTAKALVKMKESLMKEAEKARAEYVAGLSAFEWTTDEKTKEKTAKDPEAVKKYDMDFLEKTFVLNRRPISVKDLPEDKVTPNQLLQLKPILSGLDD